MLLFKNHLMRCSYRNHNSKSSQERKSLLIKSFSQNFYYLVLSLLKIMPFLTGAKVKKELFHLAI